MDREVVDALLGLLDESVTINFPGQILGLAVDLFESLIDRHRADGDWRVSQNPLAGDVDVLAGGKIHHVVGAPFGGPAHFLDLFLDRRGDGGVADVGVDFDEEITADDHRFAFRVVDVEWNDRATCGYLAADELRCDFLRDALWEALEDIWRIGAVRLLAGAGVLLVEAVAKDVVLLVGNFSAAHVLADRDELHLGGDDALVRVVFLGDRLAGATQRLATLGGETGELDELVGLLRLGGELGVFLGEVAVVLWLDGATVVGLDISTFQNPLTPQRGKPLIRGSFEFRVAPWAGAVVNTDGFVFLNGAVVGLGISQSDFAHWHLNFWMEFALHINPGRCRKRRAGFVVVRGLRSGGFFGADHNVSEFVSWEISRIRKPSENKKTAGLSRLPPAA